MRSNWQSKLFPNPSTPSAINYNAIHRQYGPWLAAAYMCNPTQRNAARSEWAGLIGDNDRNNLVNLINEPPPYPGNQITVDLGAVYDPTTQEWNDRPRCTVDRDGETFVVLDKYGRRTADQFKLPVVDPAFKSMWSVVFGKSRSK